LPLALAPLQATATRHIPDGRDPLDFSYAAVSPLNRWNDQGVPAIYLAAGRDVCAAEYGRHLDASPVGKVPRAKRAVYEYEVNLRFVLDLRAADAQANVGLTPMTKFLDRDACRAAARRARSADSRLEALLVPSVAFLDDMTRWSLVVYLDRTTSLEAFGAVRRVGSLSYSPSPMEWLRQAVRSLTAK
jgi:RES domain-containing protein